MKINRHEVRWSLEYEDFEEDCLHITLAGAGVVLGKGVRADTILETIYGLLVAYG